MSRFEIPAQEQEDTPPRLEFRFLLAGANYSDHARHGLQEELQDLIANMLHLNLLPVNQGLQMDLEVESIQPFSEADYEAYLVDHILLPVLNRQSEAHSGAVRVQPLRSRRP